MFPRRQCRLLAAALLLLVVLVNSFIFLLLPDSVRQIPDQNTEPQDPGSLGRDRGRAADRGGTGATDKGAGGTPAPEGQGARSDLANLSPPGLAHLPALRRHLDRSNYSSDPDGGDPELRTPRRLPSQPPMANPGAASPSPRAQPPGTWNGSQGFRPNYTDPEVDRFIEYMKTMEPERFDLGRFDKVSFPTFVDVYRKRRTKVGRPLTAYRNYKGVSNWEAFHASIHQHALYDPDNPAIPGLLRDMATLPIEDIEQKEGGTQLKLIITYSDEGQALFKPMRFSRERGTLPDHFYFVDYERHVAEIAAFHLDRMLGFYRVPPTAGRLVNITSEFQRLADDKLARTFFRSPAGNVCFHGSCSYYCDTSHAVCGHPDLLEGSFAAYLPPSKMAARKTWRHPWRRSYSKHRSAYWEVYDDMCDKVRNRPPFNNGRRLLDLMDMAVFDFLQGNMDRHHYETFREFGNDSAPLHMDNGRGFGRWDHDELSILAPVYQCCHFRYSTLAKLIKLYRGPNSLSQVMRAALSRDKVAPVLIELHLDALDRRVVKVLKIVSQCVGLARHWKDVIVDDSI